MVNNNQLVADITASITSAKQKLRELDENELTTKELYSAQCALDALENAEIHLQEFSN